MTLVYERPVQGEGAHALVIGVGGYPFAKPGLSVYGANTPLALTNVPDLDSAPVGAKLFADWLVSHADHLPVPLASVEMALSAPASAPAQAREYEWKARLAIASGTDPRTSAAVDGTDGASILHAGLDWAKRFQVVPNQTAIFYICGHGTAVPTRSLVLLSDVAGGPIQNPAWQPYVDVQYLASVMSRFQGLKQGYLFVDACRQVITDAVMAEADKDLGESLRFFPWNVSLASSANKVLLLVPGPMGQLAYDDGLGGGGRYTQVLVEALNGAGARNYSGAGQWGVVIDNLPKAMKVLYRLRGWPHDGFDPTPIRTLVTDTPLVRYPAPPIVPFAVRLEPPEAINHAHQLCLQDATRNIIVSRTDKAERWIGRVQARMELCYVQATFNQQGGVYRTADPTAIDLSEMRVEPIYIHTVIR